MEEPHLRVAPAPAEPLPFHFTGRGSEFFRIWIVNLLLSILTLGIYSAWAKVRTNRYFWGHTHLEGSTFAYLASPIAILKGRLLVAGFFGISGLASAVFPPAQFVFTALLLGLLPWAVARSIAFRAQNTAYRGVRFDFRGRYAEALRAYVLIPMLLPFTLGLVAPYMLYQQKRFLADRSRYGTTPFRLRASSRDFYAVVLGTLALLVLGLGAVGLTSLEQPLLAALAGPPLFLFVAAHWSAAIGNLVYGNLRLGEHAFESRLRAGELFTLYATNVLGILLTLGLFIPWAQVRLARYRLSRIGLVPAEDLDSFVAAELEEVKSLGAEFGDFLDIDIGL